MLAKNSHSTAHGIIVCTLSICSWQQSVRLLHTRTRTDNNNKTKHTNVLGFLRAKIATEGERDSERTELEKKTD